MEDNKQDALILQWARNLHVALKQWLASHKDKYQFGSSLQQELGITLPDWGHIKAGNGITVQRRENYAKLYFKTGLPEADPRTIPPRVQTLFGKRSIPLPLGWSEEEWQAWLKEHSLEIADPELPNGEWPRATKEVVYDIEELRQAMQADTSDVSVSAVETHSVTPVRPTTPSQKPVTEPPAAVPSPVTLSAEPIPLPSAAPSTVPTIDSSVDLGRLFISIAALTLSDELVPRIKGLLDTNQANLHAIIRQELSVIVTQLKQVEKEPELPKQLPEKDLLEQTIRMLEGKIRGTPQTRNEFFLENGKLITRLLKLVDTLSQNPRDREEAIELMKLTEGVSKNEQSK